MNVSSPPPYQATYNNVGYTIKSANVDALFSRDTLVFIAKQVNDLLRDIVPQGIIVPLDIIKNVLNAVFQSYIPSVGAIHSRYTIVDEENDNSIDAIVNQTIQIVVSQIRADILTQERNSKLSVWASVLGEGVNAGGLRAHPEIKLLRKRPQPMLFNMKY